MNLPLATTSFAYKADAIISGCEMAPDNSLEYFFNKSAARDMMLFTATRGSTFNLLYVWVCLLHARPHKSSNYTVTPKITK